MARTCRLLCSKGLKICSWCDAIDVVVLLLSLVSWFAHRSQPAQPGSDLVLVTRTTVTRGLQVARSTGTGAPRRGVGGRAVAPESAFPPPPVRKRRGFLEWPWNRPSGVTTASGIRPSSLTPPFRLSREFLESGPREPAGILLRCLHAASTVEEEQHRSLQVKKGNTTVQRKGNTALVLPSPARMSPQQQT